MKKRMQRILLCLVVCLGIAACNDEGGEVEKGSVADKFRQQASVTTVLVCKIVRERYESAAKVFFVRHQRYPSSLKELRKKAISGDASGCKAGGTYTMDKMGRVTCSVHGR